MLYVLRVPFMLEALICLIGCGGQVDSSGTGKGLGLSPNGTRVPDTDCRGVCLSDHNSYCGNNNRIGVYSMVSRENPPTPDCSTGLNNVSLVAETSTGQQIPLKAVVVEMVPSVTWTVLSVRRSPFSHSSTFSLSFNSRGVHHVATTIRSLDWERRCPHTQSKIQTK